MPADAPDRTFNILFLCTSNSARSIVAESPLNKRGGACRAYSAGSHPKGEVNPDAIALLKRLDYPTKKLRSKVGKSSRLPMRRKWISSSRSATMLPVKSARCGLAIP